MNRGIRRLAGALLAVTVAVGLGACKIRVSLPDDLPGAVVTQSGNYYCLRNTDGEIDEDSTCNIDVVDIHFDETFVAVTDTGYVFSGWKKDHRHFCGGSRKPCRLATSGFAGNDKLMGILEDDQQEFVLEPIFVPGDVAITGDYEGNWNNVTYGSSGAISLQIVDNGDDTFDFTLDLDGNVFGQGDPGPVTIVAQLQQDGSITASGELTIAGTAAAYQFSIDGESNLLQILVPELPVAGFDAFEVRGTINGGTGFLEYAITLDGSEPVRGTATLYKP